MSSVATPYAPIAADLPRVAVRLESIGTDQHPLLGETLKYVFHTHGKQVRPALVLLCGKLGTYVAEDLVTLAVSLEVVHTASLVHDDTIDEALSRRGLTTVSALWDNKIAILVGDYLFGQSAFLAAQLDDVRIMSLLSEMVMELTSGELRQYAAAQNGTVDEDDYLRRISGKTASLFRMCCEGAAIVSRQSVRNTEALRAYGHNLGLAFQIADDVLDFMGSDAVLGKPAGSDLRHGIATLPAILFIDDLPIDSPMRARVLQEDDIDTVVAAVRASDAPARALERARQYAEQAVDSLVMFPDSEAREALCELALQVVDRSA